MGLCVPLFKGELIGCYYLVVLNMNKVEFALKTTIAEAIPQALVNLIDAVVR